MCILSVNGASKKEEKIQAEPPKAKPLKISPETLQAIDEFQERIKERTRALSNEIRGERMRSMRRGVRRMSKDLRKRLADIQAVDKPAIKEEKFALFPRVSAMIMLMFDRSYQASALSAISKFCLDEEPETEDDIFLIEGFLTEEIDKYFMAVHFGDRAALESLLEADRENRQRELASST